MILRSTTHCALIALAACGTQPVVDDEPLPPTAIRWLEQALLSKHAEIRSKAFASYERHWPQLREFMRARRLL